MSENEKKSRRSRGASALVFEFDECDVTIRETPDGMRASIERRDDVRPLSKAEQRKVLVLCARAGVGVGDDLQFFKL